MPPNPKPNPPKAKGKSSADSSDPMVKLQTTQKIQGNDIATLKWVIGIGLGTVLIVTSILVGVVTQFTLQNSSENADLRRENIEIRADHNALRVEFEIYKSQNPPKNPQ